MRRSILFTWSLVAATFLGCGGSGPLGLPAPVDLSEIFPSPLRNFEGSLTANGLRVTDQPLRVGDDVSNLSWRAFTSFAMNEPPARKVLKSARLRLYQGGLMGTPYPDLGVLLVERVDMGSALDAADWAVTADASSPPWTDPMTGEIQIDVTPLVQKALDLGTARVDMRLRFTLTAVADGVAQQTQFTSYTQGVEPLTLAPSLVLDWSDAP